MTSDTLILPTESLPDMREGIGIRQPVPQEGGLSLSRGGGGGEGAGTNVARGTQSIF